MKPYEAISGGPGLVRSRLTSTRTVVITTATGVLLITREPYGRSMDRGLAIWGSGEP